MADDVLINKASTIERCVRRAREEYAKDPAGFGADFTRQDAAILNIQRACEAALKGGIPVGQAADDLWRAQKLLAQITGQNATEDVLDAIFRNFCVGK